ncbi:hypothetical protein evm_011819 [Chilo suppressalis]|nr:hypothetical protein evm_011819 [Chilo suppressalis]
MRAWLYAAAVTTLLALPAAAARRSDQDFEFDDDSEANVDLTPVHSRKPRRYIYDPHNSLCQSLVCKRREVCLLKDAFTALCANKKEILRKGDTIVAGSVREDSVWGREDDDDVFYEGGTGSETGVRVDTSSDTEVCG